MSLDKGAARRREQLAEILAEGDAVPPAAIPESHVQLVERRLEHLARGNVTPLESEQVWAQLRSRSSRRPVRRKKVARKATARRR
jgi:Mg-chelatase subunit ChlD